MKSILALLLLALSFSSIASITAPCEEDYFVEEEIGEYYFHERMKITNEKGEMVGSLLINFSLVMGPLMVPFFVVREALQMDNISLI